MLHRDHTADPARRRLNQLTKLGFAWTEQIFRNSAKTFFFFETQKFNHFYLVFDGVFFMEANKHPSESAAYVA